MQRDLNIQMVDLKTQYEHIKNDVDNAMQQVINSTQFINGDEVKNFQAELADYLGVKHVITCGNGTDALQIAMMGLGLKPGDEVITPSFTYIATTEVIGLLGLKPVFVDCDLCSRVEDNILIGDCLSNSAPYEFPKTSPSPPPHTLPPPGRH